MSPVLVQPLPVSGAYALLLTGTGLYVRSVLESGRYPGAGSPDGVTPPDTLMALAAALQMPVLVATAVVFIIWFHRAHTNAKAFRPDVATRSSGWAIGGWFIPFGNLVIPCRMAREIWDASSRSTSCASSRRCRPPGPPKGPTPPSRRWRTASGSHPDGDVVRAYSGVPSGSTVMRATWSAR
ncbi:DUF4328 domain-containing protein [Streptomyces sp. NPDC058401]|uniref:DUF4328 domain-containing protein n=1 Tax=Streptomyces sp. NPDC058401 TaxID=3346480 RepID=UPI0036519E5F